MRLVDSLPKDDEGLITLEPGGRYNGEDLIGTVSEEWFRLSFPFLADADVPLTDDQFEKLKSIDEFWEINAKRWRDEGLI